MLKCIDARSKKPHPFCHAGQAVPFEISFISDDNEQASGDAAINNEAEIAPGGIVGFSLDYTQQSC